MNVYILDRILMLVYLLVKNQAIQVPTMTRSRYIFVLLLVTLIVSSNCTPKPEDKIDSPKSWQLIKNWLNNNGYRIQPCPAGYKEDSNFKCIQVQ